MIYRDETTAIRKANVVVALIQAKFNIVSTYRIHEREFPVIHFKIRGKQHSISLEDTDVTWATIARIIEKKKSATHGAKCNICYKSKYRDLSCNQCGTEICYDCYVNIIKQQFGLFTCPYCRLNVGARAYDEQPFPSVCIWSKVLEKLIIVFLIAGR